jgi:hypothetical protein
MVPFVVVCLALLLPSLVLMAVVVALVGGVGLVIGFLGVVGGQPVVAQWLQSLWSQSSWFSLLQFVRCPRLRTLSSRLAAACLFSV